MTIQMYLRQHSLGAKTLKKVNKSRPEPAAVDQYWASITEPDLLLDYLADKKRVYYDDLRSTGLMYLYERSYRAYYGGRIQSNKYRTSLFASAGLEQGGRQGEKTLLKVNHYRNFIQHTHQLVTSTKPATEARSSNTDYKSQAQTLLANGLNDYYWREKNVGRVVSDAAEMSLVFLEAFVYSQWNPTAGNVYQVDSMGKGIKEGDQEYTLLAPWDMIRDPARKKAQDGQWRIARMVANRWDEMAKFPQFVEQLKNTISSSESDDDEVTFSIRQGNDPKNTDLIYLHHFIHDKTDAMPDGRLIIYVEDCILFDGPLPYSQNPVYRIVSKELYESIYGYSIAVDLLGIQEAIDELTTALMSNNKTFSIQSLWMDINDKVSVTTLEGGMKLFKSLTKPEALQLTATAPEAYQFLALLEQWAETISGISSTVRGQPESSLKSGTALALVVSQSIQFISSFEESFNRLIEDVGSALIYNLRDFSTTPRVAMIIGESNRPFSKSFVGGDLSGFNRFVVDRASPMSKTIAGRAEIAGNLLNQGMLKTPEEYIAVLTTGQLDPATQSSQYELLNIRAENEELREGRQVMAVVTENHLLHIQEHKTLIENPDAKNDAQLVQMVTAHLTDHIQKWRNADPAILMATGQQPAPILPPPPMAPGSPVQPNSNSSNPAPAPQTTAEVGNTTPPVEQMANKVNQPGMPPMPKDADPASKAAYDKMKGNQ